MMPQQDTPNAPDDDGVDRLTALAAAVRCGDQLEISRAIRRTLIAFGDPTTALRMAAALIDVHHPITRWWDPGDNPTCGVCGRVLLGAHRNRRYCSGACFATNRRLYWRTRARHRRATAAAQQQPVGAS